jgi:hypothetical protein
MPIFNIGDRVSVQGGPNDGIQGKVVFIFETLEGETQYTVYNDIMRCVVIVQPKYCHIFPESEMIEDAVVPDDSGSSKETEDALLPDDLGSREQTEKSEEADEVPPAKLPPDRRLIVGGRKSEGLFEEAEDAVVPDALGS